MQNVTSPAVIRGRMDVRWPSVPKRKRSGPLWRSAIQCALTGAPLREQLFEHDVALERRPFVTAVLLGPGHPDPAARAELAAELRIEAHPAAGPLLGGAFQPGTSAATNSRTSAREGFDRIRIGAERRRSWVPS